MKTRITRRRKNRFRKDKKLIITRLRKYKKKHKYIYLKNKLSEKKFNIYKQLLKDYTRTLSFLLTDLNPII